MIHQSNNAFVCRGDLILRQSQSSGRISAVSAPSRWG